MIKIRIRSKLHWTLSLNRKVQSINHFCNNMIMWRKLSTNIKATFLLRCKVVIEFFAVKSLSSLDRFACNRLSGIFKHLVVRWFCFYECLCLLNLLVIQCSFCDINIYKSQEPWAIKFLESFYIANMSENSCSIFSNNNSITFCASVVSLKM